MSDAEKEVVAKGDRVWRVRDDDRWTVEEDAVRVGFGRGAPKVGMGEEEPCTAAGAVDGRLDLEDLVRVLPNEGVRVKTSSSSAKFMG